MRCARTARRVCSRPAMASERDAAAHVRSKLPNVGTTIFTVMSKLAADVGAINLSQGFPDFGRDPALVDAGTRHMRDPRNQYAPMQGVPDRRQAIAAKFVEPSGATYDGKSGI